MKKKLFSVSVFYFLFMVGFSLQVGAFNKVDLERRSESCKRLDKDTVLNEINLYTKETPREILEEDNPSTGNIPILGGWGYTQEDSVIINKFDSSVDQLIPFMGVSWEHFFVEKRIYEELIIFRQPDQKFRGIRWEPLRRTYIHENDRQYEHAEFLVSSHLEKDWDYLTKIFEDNNHFEDDPVGLENHLKEFYGLLYCYEADYWFDITSYY